MVVEVELSNPELRVPFAREAGVKAGGPSFEAPRLCRTGLRERRP